MERIKPDNPEMKDFLRRGSTGKSPVIVCDDCGGYFSSFDELEKHRNEKHNGSYMCDVCGKEFTSLRGMKIHRSQAHREDIENNKVQPETPQDKETRNNYGIISTILHLLPEGGCRCKDIIKAFKKGMEYTAG